MKKLSAAEIQQKKEYLRRYRNIMCHIDVLEEKLYLLECKMKKPRHSVLSDMPKGGTSITSEELIVQKVELEDRINRQLEDARKLRSELIEKIESLIDHREAEILELYFVDQVNIADIAEVLQLSQRQVFRIYSKGVEHINI